MSAKYILRTKIAVPSFEFPVELIVEPGTPAEQIVAAMREAAERAFLPVAKRRLEAVLPIQQEELLDRI